MEKIRKINWRFLAIYTLGILYLGLLIRIVIQGPASIHYGDYISYWTVGRIADTVGYSNIYDLTLLQRFQYLTLQNTDIYSSISQFEVIAMPVPYFSLFIFPFQYLSRIDIEISYWIWFCFNFVALIGYVLYFHWKVRRLSSEKQLRNSFLLLILLTFSVYLNLSNGQINLFLAIFVGEFIWNLKTNRKIAAGIWLSGLILKPQLLILIVPVLIIKKWWRSIFGFLLASALIISISFQLSGTEGFVDLFGLWTKWGLGNYINSPMGMVNWRMIGEIIKLFTGNSKLGLIVTLVGIFTTICATFSFTKGFLNTEDRKWDLSIMGIMFATLVISWHTHLHMAIIMVPLLILNAVNRNLPEKMLWLWSGPILIAWIMTTLVDPGLGPLEGLKLVNLPDVSRAFAGFLVNMGFILWTYKRLQQQEPIRPG